MQTLGDAVTFYKIGLQLFTAAGPDFVRELRESGKKIFLDLKFHDIPNTVASAVGSVATLGVDMITVHASGGAKMLRAAVEAAASAGEGNIMILAVTVLTSLSDSDLHDMGIAIGGNSEQQVLRLAKIAQSAGCQGLVVSPQEVGAVRQLVGAEMAIVTPGIRSKGSMKDDQTRVATAADSIRDGASYLVIGRPITNVADPKMAAETILREMAEVIA